MPKIFTESTYKSRYKLRYMTFDSATNKWSSRVLKVFMELFFLFDEQNFGPHSLAIYWPRNTDSVRSGWWQLQHSKSLSSRVNSDFILQPITVLVYWPLQSTIGIHHSYLHELSKTISSWFIFETDRFDTIAVSSCVHSPVDLRWT